MKGVGGRPERPANAQIKQCSKWTRILLFWPALWVVWSVGHCGSLRVALIIELVAIKHEINFRAAGYAMPQKQNEASGALKSMLHA